MTLQVIAITLATVSILLSFCALWLVRKVSHHIARSQDAAERALRCARFAEDAARETDSRVSELSDRMRTAQRKHMLPNKITWTKADFAEMERITRPPPMGKPSRD